MLFEREERSSLLASRKYISESVKEWGYRTKEFICLEKKKQAKYVFRWKIQYNRICLRLFVPMNTKKWYKCHRDSKTKTLQQLHLCSCCSFQTCSLVSLVVLIEAFVPISNIFLFVRRGCLMSTVWKIDIHWNLNVESYFVFIYSNQYG